MYNISNITSATNPFQQLFAVNQLSGGLYTTMIIIALYIILFVVFRHHEFKVSILGISFMMFIISGFAVFLELVGLSVAIASAVLFFISLLIFRFMKD